MTKISEHFDRDEFRCKGENCHPSGTGNCGFDTVDVGLVNLLERIRQHFDKPVIINSGCRCMAHNEREGGSRNSQHVKGRAADIVVVGIEPDDVADYAYSIAAGGVGRYNNFSHIDSRSNGPAGWSGNY